MQYAIGCSCNVSSLIIQIWLSWLILAMLVPLPLWRGPPLAITSGRLYDIEDIISSCHVKFRRCLAIRKQKSNKSDAILRSFPWGPTLTCGWLSVGCISELFAS